MRDVSAGTMGEPVCERCGYAMKTILTEYRWREDVGLVAFHESRCDHKLVSWGELVSA